MQNTERLGLPIVEGTDTFDKQLWNLGNQQIDQKCIAYDIIATLTCPANQETITYSFNGAKYLFFDLVPTYPDQAEEWNLIALASYRCWYNEEENKIYLHVEGQVPTKDVYVSIFGWY